MYWFILFPVLALGSIIPIDDTVPYLTSLGRPLQWSNGADALMLAGRGFIRVNQRGITTKSSGWTVRDLGENGWQTRRCLPGGNSLCESSNTSRVFPTDPNRPRYSARHRPSSLRCTRDKSQRMLDHTWEYDISACDVLDGGGDVVVWHHRVAIRDTGVSSLKYWVLCILAIFIVRSFSYKAMTQYDPGHTPMSGLSKDQWTIAACSVSVLLAITPNSASELVTEEDLFCCCFLVFYSAFYILVWTVFRHSANAPIYNLIAATLQITVSRLYKGIETPYSGVLIYVVITRLLIKLRCPFSVARCLTLSVDCMLISLLAVFGVSFQGIYTVVIAILAFATSDCLVEQ